MHLHSHTHGVQPGFDHSHQRGQGMRALRIALTVTLVFMVAEFVGGLWTNSLALLADAGHMLTDAAALGLGLFAAWAFRRPATPEKTYGYFRVEILAALANGTTLIIIAFLILYESYDRFLQPQPVKSLEMLMVASMGFMANLFSAWILYGSRDVSLNIRGAFLHVVGDILGSLGAIIASLAILFGGVYWADPAVSVLVALLIILSAWKLVKDSVSVLLEEAPAHVDLSAMKQELCKVPGVESVHDLHVWTLTSGIHAMTCHAVVSGPTDRHSILEQLTAVSKDHFEIDHTTIQLEEESTCPNETLYCH